MQSRMRRLQLRGSGGFSPRFPNIAPAELRFTAQCNSLDLVLLLFLSFGETKTDCG